MKKGGFFFSFTNWKVSNGTEYFWNIPNLITSLRIVSAILSSILLFTGIWLTLTFFLKFFEAISDLVDGLAARFLNCETQFGAKFDPVADKIITGLSASFILLVTMGFLAYLNRSFPTVDIDQLIMLIYLDALLFLMGTIAPKFGLPVKANIAGKIKMTCECIFINFWYLSYLAPLGIRFDPEVSALWSNEFIRVSIAFATCSIILHLAKYLKIRYSQFLTLDIRNLKFLWRKT